MVRDGEAATALVRKVSYAVPGATSGILLGLNDDRWPPRRELAVENPGVLRYLDRGRATVRLTVLLEHEGC